MLRIFEPRPVSLLVRFDGGLSLGQREPQPDIGVHVAVGHVVNHLAHGPAALAVRSLELRVGEPSDGGPYFCRGGGNFFNRSLAHGGGDASRHRKWSNGITRVHTLSSSA